MTVREIGISLHEELDRREILIAQLQGERDAIRAVLEILERPTPQAHNRVTKVVGRRGSNANSTPHISLGKNSKCTRHPNAERDGKGACKQCKSEYMKAYFAKKKKQAAAQPESGINTRNPSNVEPVRSSTITVRCPECSESFNDARSMGIHRTRAHFGTSSPTGSSIGRINQ